MQPLEIILLIGIGSYILFGVSKMILENKFDTEIYNITTKYDNDPFLVKAIIKQESGFNEKAHAKTDKEDSRGLGQINAKTAILLGIEEDKLDTLFIPEINITVMNKLLQNLQMRYNNIKDIISAYNAGSVKKTSSGEYINQAYVDSVFTNYEYYKQITVFDVKQDENYSAGNVL
jgi:soluble lytic murein transglycosylase-like protein